MLRLTWMFCVVTCGAQSHLSTVRIGEKLANSVATLCKTLGERHRVRTTRVAGVMVEVLCSHSHLPQGNMVDTSKDAAKAMLRHLHEEEEISQADYYAALYRIIRDPASAEALVAVPETERTSFITLFLLSGAQ